MTELRLVTSRESLCRAGISLGLCECSCQNCCACDKFGQHPKVRTLLHQCADSKHDNTDTRPAWRCALSVPPAKKKKETALSRCSNCAVLFSPSAAWLRYFFSPDIKSHSLNSFFVLYQLVNKCTAEMLFKNFHKPGKLSLHLCLKNRRLLSILAFCQFRQAKLCPHGF